MAPPVPPGYRFEPYWRRVEQCPYTDTPMFGQAVAKPPAGPWGIRSAVLGATAQEIEQAAQRKKQEAAPITSYPNQETYTPPPPVERYIKKYDYKFQPKSARRFGLHPASVKKAADRFYECYPEVDKIFVSSEGQYTPIELFRILDRADPIAATIIVTWFRLFWLEQTKLEQVVGGTVVSDKKGYNVADIRQAKTLLAELDRLDRKQNETNANGKKQYPYMLVRQLSYLLSRYYKQLLRILNAQLEVPTMAGTRRKRIYTNPFEARPKNGKWQLYQLGTDDELPDAYALSEANATKLIEKYDREEAQGQMKIRGWGPRPYQGLTTAELKAKAAAGDQEAINEFGRRGRDRHGNVLAGHRFYKEPKATSSAANEGPPPLPPREAEPKPHIFREEKVWFWGGNGDQPIRLTTSEVLDTLRARDLDHPERGSTRDRRNYDLLVCRVGADEWKPWYEHDELIQVFNGRRQGLGQASKNPRFW